MPGEMPVVSKSMMAMALTVWSGLKSERHYPQCGGVRCVFAATHNRQILFVPTDQ
jgi:hypothetical protein